MCACQIASVMSDSATLWTVARQAPLSIGFSGQEYLSGLPCPPPKDPPNPGMELALLHWHVGSSLLVSSEKPNN